MVKVKEDLTGKRFGYLTVLEQAEDYVSPNNQHRSQWLCECDCGNKIIQETSRLKTNKNISCGCKSKDRESLNGQTFNYLTVLSYAFTKNNQRYWNCKCKCGNLCTVNTHMLKSGNNKSCGCYVKEISRLNGLQRKKENIIIGEDDYIIINNKVLIDKEDLDLILSFDRYVSINKSGYALMWVNDKELFLHRLIMGLSDRFNKNDNLIVDHINGNKLDNRKSNLRICTKNKNPINCDIYKNNTSGEKGVYWNKKLQKWVAAIQCNNQPHHLGVFENFEDAVKARKEAEDKYFGEYKRAK